MRTTHLTLLTFLIFFLSNFLTAQTCTSSGGDDIPDDFEPYHFRCGTSMMHHKYKDINKDYKLIESCNNYWADGNYYTFKGEIYYSMEYGEYALVKGAKAKTFRCEEGTAKDDNQFYFKGKPISNIDKASFKSVGLSYCVDNNNVYYRNRYSENDGIQKIEVANTSKIEIIGENNSAYIKDDQHVYFNGKAIPNSDPNSFELLDYGYAHDKHNVYYSGEKIEGMNGATFTIIKDCYLGSDGIQLCNGGNVLKNSDAATFKAIECGYYTDKKNVYLNGSILEGVDSKSFEILSWGYTKDRNAVYCDLQIINGANPATFEVLARKHAKDDQNIFYLHNMMDCDYATFRIDTEFDYISHDKNYTYSRGIKSTE